MHWQRPIVALSVLTIMSAACDPIFGTEYRQTLTPAPASDCLAAALASSPVVSSVAPHTRNELGPKEPGFKIVLRDTFALRWPTFVTQDTLAGLRARVAVTYVYAGFASPPPRVRRQWEVSARRLLADVRASCAPTSADSVECRATGGFGGQRGACRTTA